MRLPGRRTPHHNTEGLIEEARDLLQGGAAATTFAGEVKVPTLLGVKRVPHVPAAATTVSAGAKRTISWLVRFRRRRRGKGHRHVQ